MAIKLVWQETHRRHLPDVTLSPYLTVDCRVRFKSLNLLIMLNVVYSFLYAFGSGNAFVSTLLCPFILTWLHIQHTPFTTVTSEWALWRLKSSASPLFTQPFVQAQIKENIKAPRRWSLCGEFTGHRWIPRPNGQQRGKCFHLMTLSCVTHQCFRGRNLILKNGHMGLKSTVKSLI